MYLTRFILAGSLVAIASALLATFALLPTYLVLHTVGDTTASTPSVDRKRSEIQSERAEITRAQSLITALSPFVSSTTTVSGAIGTALALRPKGVSVDLIRYVSKEIIIVGSASTRDGINAYRQTLQSDPHFKTVSVPVGDLAGTQGGRFSVTLTGEF